ncbi:MAG: acyl dehydratase [Planctomycetota bacterium]|jgi:acyl dehydratase
MSDPSSPDADSGPDITSEPGGRWFEEFVPGQVYLSARRTVTETDIVNFAGLSGDFNPLHTDEVHAIGTPFRGRVAHGLLVQSIASGLANQMGIFHGTISALKGMTIDFTRPVKPGDTIRMRLTVTEIDPKPGARRGGIQFRTEVLNERDELVIDGSWSTVINRRSAAGKRRRSTGSIPTTES